MPNAIVSVYDKNNLEELVAILRILNFNIFATEGTLNSIKKITNYSKVYPISMYCQNPHGVENYFSSLSFNSLVGTLTNEHVKIGDIFVENIDVVVYNFVPSWDVVKTYEDFNILNVDLGGPTIVRAAAINFKHALPIISPKQYPILRDFNSIDMQMRIELAQEAFAYCAWYDNCLNKHLKSLSNK